MLLRMEAVVDLYVLMILGRGANGGVRIKSEPTLIAAAQQMGSKLVIQQALPVGKLVQIEIAAEVQLKKGRRRIGQRDIPRLGSDAGKRLGGQFHTNHDLRPVRDCYSYDELTIVRVRSVFLEIEARSCHDSSDPSRVEIDCPEAVTGSPVVVGWVGACCDLGGGAVHDRSVEGHEYEQTHPPEPRPETFGQRQVRA